LIFSFSQKFSVFVLVVFFRFDFNVPAGTFTQPRFKAFTNKKNSVNNYCKGMFKLPIGLFLLGCGDWLTWLRTLRSVFGTSLSATGYT
jgi:hypothetical protein